MRKTIAHIWIIIIIISIEMPSYIHLFDLDHDTSLIVDSEELEDIEGEKEDSDIKIFTDANFLISYTSVQNKVEILYFSKQYNSISKTLDSPPPEIIS